MQSFTLKRYRAGVILIYALAAAALVVAVFYDLKIDIAVNNTDDGLSNWLARTGEVPAWALPMAAGALLAKCLTNPWLKRICALFCLAGGGLLGDYLSKHLFLDDAFRRPFGIVFGVGTAVILLLLVRLATVPERLRKPLIALALISLAVCAAATLLVTGMKALWGRTRFREMEAPYEAFTAWYVVNGVNGHKSFPSGHTESAAMSYLLLCLPWFSEKAKRYAWACFAVPFVFTSAVAATRLVMGAHYLSDVAAGGVIGFTCVLLGLWIYERKIACSTI